jgi:DNA gyrase inhibitor GyrI
LREHLEARPKFDDYLKEHGLYRREARDDSKYPVIVRPAAAREVAYVRVVRPYEGSRVTLAFDALREWLARNGVADALYAGVSHDDPEVVPLEYCLYDACAALERALAPADGVSVRSLDGGFYAELRVTGDLQATLDAWEYLYRTWLPVSGYEPAAAPCIEVLRSAPSDGPFDLTCQIPILLLSALQSMPFRGSIQPCLLRRERVR